MLRGVVFGTLAYMLAVFPLAYAWHLVIFRERFENMGYMGRPEPIVALGFGAILFQAIVFASLFAAFRAPGNVFAQSFKVCVPLTALVWSAQVLAHAAKFQVQIGPFLALETAYFVLQAILVSLAIGIAFSIST